MHKVLQEIEENRKSRITVCSDPTKGSPEDFAEDFDNLFWALVEKARNAGLSEKEIFEMAERGTSAGEAELAEKFKNGYKALVDRNRANAKASEAKNTKCEEYTSQCITKGNVVGCAEALGVTACPFIQYEKE